MKTEQSALRLSLYAVLFLAALGITFGLISGSTAIMFDGVFSLVDAVMSVVSIIISSLIARSTMKSGLSKKLRSRFTMGFWHFEPLILAVNSLLMVSIACYALVGSIGAILEGGRDVAIGPAVIYAAVVLVLTITIGLVEHRANKRLNSALVAMDVKGWLMAGGVTSALLIAFLVAFILQQTSADWLVPYVDPGVLIVVALVLIPVPIPILRKAVAELALVTPADLMAKAQRVASDTAKEHQLIDYRIWASRQGRSDVVELDFQASPDEHRPLAEWDRIRMEVERALGGEDRNHWIAVRFTTKDLAEAADRI